MNQNIFKYLKDYSYNTWDINRLLVSSFISVNNITRVNNNFIQSYIISKNDIDEFKQLSDFLTLFSNLSFSIEELIELFEFVISPADKEVNGAVFTPEYIRKFIVENTIKQQTDNKKESHSLRFSDIACGCGGFFKTITEYLRKHTNKSYYDIYNENIYGLDIQEYSIIRTKILLSLLAIIDGDDSSDYSFNLYNGNALSFDWTSVEEIKKNNGFDVIIGNPPYVGASKIDYETKLLLKSWSVSSSGKADLYIPFFEIAMENINNTGIVGYITVNTFYKSLNGRSVRSYFSSNKFDLSIIDFGGEQLFRKRSTYTCICIIGKQQSSNIKYLKTTSKEINNINFQDYESISYLNLNDFNGWYLVNNKNSELISKIESTGIPLGDKFTIRNGFATLKNKIYIFKPIKETKEFYYLEKDKHEFKIEKNICRDTIKPNTLKSELELSHKMEKIIFPYIIDRYTDNLFGTELRKLKILEEKEFKSKYPFAYKYLLSEKETLAQRDKGSREYEKWYAYGRNQALTLYGYKLLFPYITSQPCFVFTDDKELMFYNGYAILSDSEEELKVLQKILKSRIFWFYIEKTSKPYAGRFFSVAKNYVKNFGVCELSEEEKKELLSIEDQSEIDDFLEKKYDVVLN